MNIEAIVNRVAGRVQLWEPCEKCGEEPSYISPSGRHLCQKCSTKVTGYKPSIADLSRHPGVTYRLFPDKSSGDINAGYSILAIFYLNAQAVRDVSVIIGVQHNVPQYANWEYDRGERCELGVWISPMMGTSSGSKLNDAPAEWSDFFETFIMTKIVEPIIKRDLRKIQRESGYNDAEAREIAEAMG